MIIKSYEIKKINTIKNCLVLFYGKNDGLKNETIKILNKTKQFLIVLIFSISYDFIITELYLVD